LGTFHYNIEAALNEIDVIQKDLPTLKNQARENSLLEILSRSTLWRGNSVEVEEV
jgi:hypothetical protein